MSELFTALQRQLDDIASKVRLLRILGLIFFAITAALFVVAVFYYESAPFVHANVISWIGDRVSAPLFAAAIMIVATIGAGFYQAGQDLQKDHKNKQELTTTLREFNEAALVIKGRPEKLVGTGHALNIAGTALDAK